MINLNLGRLLSLVIPGLLTIATLALAVLGHCCAIPLGRSGDLIAQPQTLSVLLTIGAALLVGILIDHFRHWFLHAVFTRYANFWGFFGRWWRWSYFSARINDRPLRERDKGYAYWHKQYTDAYNEAYKLWWESALAANQESIDLAKTNEFTHALYAMNRTTWEIDVGSQGASKKQILITNGQIWPILATRRKDAFRFHQEYFLSDLSANVLVSLAFAFTVSFAALVIDSVHGLIVHEHKVAIMSYAVLYILFAQVAARQQLAQLRFFRFVLLYDAVGALDAK